VSAVFNGFYLLRGIPHSLSGSEREWACSFLRKVLLRHFLKIHQLSGRFSLSETFHDFSM
jgi:hypothetical protein